MNNKTLVSIIIPVYNVERFLTQCIESVISQLYHNLEIILIDDGSTDNSSTICDKFAKIDNRINVIHQENQGISVARNLGLNIAKGDYIFFLDSDDYLNESAIELLLNNIIENESDMCLSNIELVNESGEHLHRDIIDFSQYESLDENTLWELSKTRYEITVACSKLYKRDIWDDIRFPIGKIHEDEAVLHKVISKSKKITAINDRCFSYRQNSNSIMGSGFQYKNIALSEVLEDRLRYFLDKNNQEMAIYTFGTGSRVLLRALFELKDCNITKDAYFKKLKRDYKRFALDIIRTIPEFKIITRMLIFCVNIRLYGLIRKQTRKSYITTKATLTSPERTELE